LGFCQFYISETEYNLNWSFYYFMLLNISQINKTHTYLFQDNKNHTYQEVAQNMNVTYIKQKQ